MKTKRFVVSIVGSKSDNMREIQNAIFDALENETQDNCESPLYDCGIKVNPYIYK